MAENILQSAGLGLIILAVVMVIGGMLLIQTYQTALAVTGSGLVYTNYSVDTCLQNLPTEATACGGLATGTITSSGWNSLPPPLNMTPNVVGGPNAYDKDWATYTTEFWNNTPKTLIFNYKIPANTTSATIQLKYDNATGVPTTTNATISGGTGCRNSTGTYSFMVNVTANESFRMECINNSGDYQLIGFITMPNASFQLYEQEIWWGINKSHSNHTAATNPLVDSVFSGTGSALTTFTTLLPLMALAIVGGVAILYMMTSFGRGTA